MDTFHFMFLPAIQAECVNLMIYQRSNLHDLKHIPKSKSETIIFSLAELLWFPVQNRSLRSFYLIVEMDQSDPYLFVGEYLNITCTLDSHTVENGDNSSKLWFSYGRDIDVPDTETTILNSTSLRLSRLMTTTFDSPYMCYLRNPNFTENVWDSVAIVDTTTVRTECEYWMHIQELFLDLGGRGGR